MKVAYIRTKQCFIEKIKKKSKKGLPFFDKWVYNMFQADEMLNSLLQQWFVPHKNVQSPQEDCK